MEKVLNIIHLHIVYHNYYTGVDRYLEMYEKGISSESEYAYIKIHKIYLTTDYETLFPEIKLTGGLLSATFPLPQNQKLLFNEDFWKNKYVKVIAGMLEPYIKTIPNPVFQYHNLFLSNLAVELKNRFGGKIIAHLHCLPWKFSSNNDIRLFNELYQLYEKGAYDSFREKEKSQVTYHLSDKIICLSEVAKDYLINIHNIAPQRIEIVLNGLEFIPYCERHEKETIEILYVGKVSKDKGIYELLNALKTVNERNYKFVLKIAGSCPDKELDRIRRNYHFINIDYRGQVTFEELKELYTTCAFGVIPSLHEQCSYVALEMAMFGLPLIASEVDALAEMFNHEESALLTPLIFDADFGIQSDREKFAENIIRMLENKELRSRLSRNIRRVFEQSFTLDIMIRNTTNLYNHLVENICPK